MKVILIGTGRRPIPPIGYGGIERTIAELATALRAAGAEVEVVNRSRLDRFTTGWAFERALPRLLRERRGDVVHAHTSRAALVLGLIGRPYVYTTHTPHWLYRQNWAQRMLFQRERQAVRGAQASIALTDPFRRILEGVGGRRGPVVTIPIGVDTARFRPTGPPEPHRVLGVGTIEPRKRWHLAARAVRESGIRLRLVGPLRDVEYARKVAGEGAVLLGEVNDEALREELARAICLVHPSDSEVLPGAVLQAMAAGRVAVGGPAISAIPGTLHSPTNGEAEVESFLRTTVQELDQDLERVQRLGLEARAIVEREYAWSAVARAHLDLYRRCSRTIARGEVPRRPSAAE